MGPENCGGDGATMPIDRVDDCRAVEAPAMIPFGGEAPAPVDEEVKVEEGGGGGGKRKRGRPPRGQSKAPVVKKEEEEEDVCFICFDGGDLVLCDRRGCPKAYHPACVKRDEAFFQSKAKWNCGWHICSICQKAAYFMCYTCTYSLCKTCAKEADYLSVRENKGFCATCMRTVMMIENSAPGSNEVAQVDFDDRGSWEYLFKVYWIYLKGKLSLTLDELIQAKKPCKATPTVTHKEQMLDSCRGSSDCKSTVLDFPSQRLEVPDSKRRRTKEQLILPGTEDILSIDKSGSEKSTISSGSAEWATKELLEFVSHMKNGDLSELCQFEVQSLLLEYIKRNKLRDPRRKSQIICDSRLMSMFVKPRVGHFEMLKLLEYHFLVKEDNHKDNVPENTIPAVPSQVEGGGNNESLLMVDKDKKRRTRRKDEERGPQTNLDEFAAINVHNINLIYLRRKLMEDLFKENGKFHDKVVGSIVRIRISSGDMKKDMYRLVQVTGTVKVANPYKVCERTVDVMLEILNLSKRETLAIDAISNQDFSEDECRRFRQSIKCGLVKRMTVGQVQEKARALQEVRLNDRLETEILRLNHLRDRASEKGRKKELRQLVEKIELLKTPEERQRRLQENPQVHADPKMDTKCESDEDTGEVIKKKQAVHLKQKYSGFRKYGKDSISLQNNIKRTKFNLEKGLGSRFGERVNVLDKRKDACVSETRTVPLSTVNAPSAYNSGTEKRWHYRDPNGKVQGPFCMIQLRKWSTTGYFPHDMRVWSINSNEVDSLLLTDVLNGKFHKALPSQSSVSLPYTDRLYNCEDRHSSTVNPTIVSEGKRSNGSWNSSSATSVHQVTVHEDRRWNIGTNNDNLSSHGSTLFPNSGNRADGQCFSGQSSVESWRPIAVSIASNNLDLNVSLASVAKSTDSSARLGFDALNLPSPTPVSTDDRNSEKLTSKHQKPSQPCGPVQDPSTEELPSPTPKASGRDEKADLGIQNLPSPSPLMVDGNKIVDSTVQNMPSLPPNLGDGNENAKSNEIKPTGTSRTCDSSIPDLSDGVEKADVGIQNLPSPSPEMNDADGKFDLNIQNSPSSTPNPSDGDKKVQVNESKLPGTSSTPNLSDGGEKAGKVIQDVPSFPPKTADVNETTDLNLRNSPSSAPNSGDRFEKVQVNENKPLETSSTLKPSGRDGKADMDIHIIPIASLKTVVLDETVDLNIQKLSSSTPDPRDRAEKVQVSKGKPPGASSTLKPGVGDEKADRNIQIIPSTLARMVDVDETDNSIIQNSPCSTPDPGVRDEKVQINESESSGAHWTVSSLVEGGGAQLERKADEWVGYSPARTELTVANNRPTTQASHCDQFGLPPPSAHPPSASDWKAFGYEPIEFNTLAEESVSDLLAEVDAMEAQGDVASVYSGDEFFEDSKGDCFASIRGLGHLFDFGKSDDLSSTGDSSSLPHQSAAINEPLGPALNGVTDPIIRSNGEASTSNQLGVEMRHTSNSSRQIENGPNNRIPSELRPTDSGWGPADRNVNLSFGGSAEGTTNVGWKPNLESAQTNVDKNRGISFGFMGHERHNGVTNISSGD